MSKYFREDRTKTFLFPDRIHLLDPNDVSRSGRRAVSAAIRSRQRVDDETVAEIPAAPTGIVYGTVKRGLDILGATVGLILFSPFIFLCVIVIKLHDGGPILFCQERVGRSGEVFRLFKFRSMVVDAEALKAELMKKNRHQDNRTFKILNDPRITPVGRFMRRLSLDELPQFWNVLRGEMSLVGPRPALPSEVALYDSEDLNRLSVKPGLTCFWQVSGRSNLDFKQQMDLDLTYIRERNLGLDLLLIAKTFPAVFRGDGAA